MKATWRLSRTSEPLFMPICHKSQSLGSNYLQLILMWSKNISLWLIVIIIACYFHFNNIRHVGDIHRIILQLGTNIRKFWECGTLNSFISRAFSEAERRKSQAERRTSETEGKKSKAEGKKSNGQTFVQSIPTLARQFFSSCSCRVSTLAGNAGKAGK